MHFVRLGALPPKTFEFRSERDFLAADAAVRRLMEVIRTVKHSYRAYQISKWVLVGFTGPRGLRRPSSREVAAKIPRLGLTQRTIRRDLDRLEPHLSAARAALNKGTISIPKDPRFP